MRKLMFVITMALICGSAIAQDHRIESNDKALDLYFRPFYKFTDGHSIVVNWMGAQVGCKVSNHFAVGASYQAVEPRREHQTSDEAYQSIAPLYTGAYAGVTLSYTRPLDRHIMFSGDLLLGDGYLGVEYSHRATYGRNPRVERSRLTVLEPSVHLSTAILKQMDMSIGVGRFQALGFHTDDSFRNRELSSWEFVVGLDVKTP